MQPEHAALDRPQVQGLAARPVVGTDIRSDGTDNRSDGTDNRSDGTDYRSDGTDYRSDGTDNRTYCGRFGQPSLSFFAPMLPISEAQKGKRGKKIMLMSNTANRTYSA